MKSEGAEADKKSEQEDSGVESPNANRTIQLDKKVVADKETVKSDAATSTAEEKKDSTSTPPSAPPPAKGE